jgi:murein L,D-transpeptidase YcbB/YkuD
MLLDCVLQYGLNPADYNPKDFTYASLNALQEGKANNTKRAAFDIKMTDAIITLINNLHYGKLNPQFGHNRVDAANIIEFKADKALADALEWNSVGDMITDVQPQTEAYTNLQRHMLLLATRFTGLNFTTPVTEMRKMAINMERLRWMYTTGKTMHLTCTVRDGVLIYSKDVNGLDKGLGMRLYGK